jgi:hypothetical protein
MQGSTAALTGLVHSTRGARVYHGSSRDPLHRDDINRLIGNTAQQLYGGERAKAFRSHSLRHGGASAYAAAGVPLYVIKEFGRWQSNDRFGPRSRLSVEGESTSGSCNTSRNNYIGLSVVQVRMASPGCLTDGCPNVHPTNLDC